MNEEPAAAHRPVRLGVVGTGRIVTRSYLPILAALPEVRVAALCDLRSDRLAEAMKLLPYQADGYADYHVLLNRADLDAVLIATPTHVHEEVALAAFASGLHVFLEKPMAPTLAATDRILRAWRESGRLLQVGYVYRFSPLVRRFVEIVRSGQVGRPHQLWVHEFRAAFYDQWRYDPARSGGALLEKICHHADIFNWCLEDLPSQVVAFGGQAKIKRGQEVEVLAVDGSRIRVQDSGVVDHAWVTVRYRGGAAASFGVNFLAPHGLHGRNSSDLESLEIGVIGDEGLVACYPRRMEIRLRRAPRGDSGPSDDLTLKVPPSPGVAQGWHTGTKEMLEAFARAVQSGTAVEADGWVGRAGMLVPLAAEVSLARQAIVDVEAWLGELGTQLRPAV